MSPRSRKASPITLFLMALLVCALGSLLPAQSPAPTGVAGWSTDLPAALKAAADGHPVLALYDDDRGRFCRVMREETLADKEVAKRLAGFHCVRINVDVQKEEGLKQRLTKVPTVIFFDATGFEWERAVGLKSAAEFVRYLDRQLARVDKPAEQSKEAPRKVDVLTPYEGTRKVDFVYTSETAGNVVLTGDFADWNMNGIPMTREGNDWKVTIHLVDGIYEYQFVVDGKWTPDPNARSQKGNQYGGINSVVAIGDAKKSPIVKGGSATFYLYDPKAKEVAIAGSMNEWKAEKMFQDPSDPAMWGARIKDLEPGTYAYKFVVDGQWMTDPENYSPVYDEHKNVNSSFEIK
jgi:hypothetical protein